LYLLHTGVIPNPTPLKPRFLEFQGELIIQNSNILKNRYLEFKGELDSLKEKNKEINVIRQRRKEDQQREDVAETVRYTAENSVNREKMWLRR